MSFLKFNNKCLSQTKFVNIVGEIKLYTIENYYGSDSIMNNLFFKCNW